MISIATTNEVCAALLSIKSWKASTPSDFHIGFFQKYWCNIGKLLVDEVRKVFNGLPFNGKLNNRLISLIPKRTNLVSISDFRLISLYSVVYKVITKVLAKFVKVILPSIIKPNHTSFVLGRKIIDNIIISQQVNTFEKR